MSTSTYLTAEQIELSIANTPQVVFETTDACNLACKYCLYGDLYSTYGDRLNRYLDPANAIALLRYLKVLWDKSRNYTVKKHLFLSFYGGEPLLNIPFIESIVEYAMDCLVNEGIKVTFTMTTNGILLDRHIDFLVKHNFKILVSLDGNEYNNSYRVDKLGKPSYNRLISILDAIKQDYPQFFQNNISFNSVVHDRNSSESIIRFIKGKYDKIPSIGELNQSGVLDQSASRFKRMYRSMGGIAADLNGRSYASKMLGLTSVSAKQAYHYLRSYSGMFFDDYVDLLNTKERSYLPTGTCIPFSRKVFMTVGGELLPCERISHNYILGRIRDGHVELDFQHCADVYNRSVNAMLKLCEKCSNKRGCVQCVFCLSTEEQGRRCGGFMTESQFLEYESGMKKFLSANPDLFMSIINESVTI